MKRERERESVHACALGSSPRWGHTRTPPFLANPANLFENPQCAAKGLSAPSWAHPTGEGSHDPCLPVFMHRAHIAMLFRAHQKVRAVAPYRDGDSKKTTVFQAVSCGSSWISSRSMLCMPRCIRTDWQWNTFCHSKPCEQLVRSSSFQGC